MSHLGRRLRERMAGHSGRRVVAVMSLLVLLAGCATTGPKNVTDILWPEPPLTPRIKFVGLLRNQEDLRATQAGKRARDWFVEALLGPKKIPHSLRQPMGLALSRDEQRLYVADYAKPGVLVFDFKTQQVQPLGGKTVNFQSPLGIAVDAQDNVYVVDSGQKVIDVFDAHGALVRTITHASLERPTGIAIDPGRRRLYMSDSAKLSSEQHVVRVFDLEGNYISTFGTQGNAEGQFFFPTYLTVGEQGKLYVADTMNARVQVLDPDGHVVQTVGERGDAYGMFDKPKGVALDSFGNLYVVDSSWSNVQIFNSKGQVLLFFGGRGSVPGLLFNPTGIAISRDNRIFVADAFNGRVGIYQLINTKAEDSLTALPTELTPQVTQHQAADRRPVSVDAAKQ